MRSPFFLSRRWVGHVVRAGDVPRPLVCDRTSWHILADISLQQAFPEHLPPLNTMAPRTTPRTIRARTAANASHRHLRSAADAALDDVTAAELQETVAAIEEVNQEETQETLEEHEEADDKEDPPEEPTTQKKGPGRPRKPAPIIFNGDDHQVLDWSLTVVAKGKHCPPLWLDIIFEFFTAHGIRGSFSLERGGKNEHLHVQSIVTFKSLPELVNAIKKLLKESLGVKIGDGSKCVRSHPHPTMIPPSLPARDPTLFL
jgi:hypothetical protein